MRSMHSYGRPQIEKMSEDPGPGSKDQSEEENCDKLNNATKKLCGHPHTVRGTKGLCLSCLCRNSGPKIFEPLKGRS